MLERYLVEYCASTLAGLKTASLFSYSGEEKDTVLDCISYWNQILNPRGIYLELLYDSSARALIYVYRASALTADLSHPEAIRFLNQYGYPKGSLPDCLNHLRRRIALTQSFPHEIGLFLGYPIEDVAEFIKNQGRNCKCCGIWKVYHNEIEAKRFFAKIDKCRAIYTKLFCGGRSVLQLTVAA
ncbi:DUF3793 family protein [Faecalispora anaeroviscerum]|uniref:DUF3793 family protein n=1 Tax=Faecalispora anaeroviscerum TaxID=2991836 RepID=UPI0024B8C3D0|nr:DUF3793 family protein [Faecalispora anaeroviscerum]